VDKKFVIVSVEERLDRWREIEKAANEAESRLKVVGQAGASPELRKLVLTAKELREKADREFAAIVRAVNLGGDHPG
jgi:adenylosuccinate lyase